MRLYQGNLILLLGSLSFLSGVCSGALLVLGTYYASDIGGGSYVSFYFATYIITSIMVNFFLKTWMVSCIPTTLLSSAFLIRLSLSLLTIFILVSFDQKLMVLFLISLSASIPDSLIRVAYPTYIKNTFESKSLQKINSDYSVTRQVGYIVGPAISGFIIYHSVVTIVCLMGLISLLMMKINLMIPRVDEYKSNIERMLTNAKTQESMFLYLIKSKNISLYVSYYILLLIGFTMPASLAPLMVGYLKYSSKELGIAEAFFSLGSFVGAIVYRKLNNQVAALSMLFFASLLIPFMNFSNALLIYGILLAVGILLQSSIFIFTKLQTAVASERFGEIISSLYLYASILSALYMAMISINSMLFIHGSYYFISFLVLLSFLSYVIYLKGNGNVI
ncbi:MFS transporter [Moraxella sp. Tifton1]|uniref:MFS transporter n=1 Tax=Moraxella oculi TaxID=2940516 RepID=UPI0020125CC7|nr:MFS transporter [Moraxella sp. Tifton1]MCL1624356.1 MFS transporter [Moraxella sp. Tifton1]